MLGAIVYKKLEAAGTRVLAPQGGFYVFPDFSPLKTRLAARGIVDSVTLCERLLDDTGIAILPGAAFGRPVQELSVRIAYVDFDGTAALAGTGNAAVSEIDDRFISRHCSGVIDAIDKLCAWIA